MIRHAKTNIQKIQNMSKITHPTPIDHRFIDDMATLMAPWGWPRPVGRMFGYLLMSEHPVSLDQLAEDLEISKSNASVAARTLESFGNARRHSEPGTKRIYYSASETQTGPFSSRIQLLLQLERLLGDRLNDGASPLVRKRLDDIMEFFARMREAMEGVLAVPRRD